MECLRSLFEEWWSAGPLKMERLAFLKDVKTLLGLKPRNPIRLQHPQGHDVKPLADMAGVLAQFLRRVALPTLMVTSGTPVISPYAGGVDASEVEDDRGGEKEHIGELKFACLNPGCVGLAALGTDEVLYWRLWAIAAALQSHGIQVCALPGARWPPGSRLPGGFPYVWLGRQSSSFASVGFLILEELAGNVCSIEEWCCDRWHTIRIRDPGPGADHHAVHLCGFYAAPGGDKETWKRNSTREKRGREVGPELLVYSGWRWRCSLCCVVGPQS